MKRRLRQFGARYLVHYGKWEVIVRGDEKETYHDTVGDAIKAYAERSAVRHQDPRVIH